jgi:hypothetical protein
MRTKLLLGAAILAAGVASTMAQSNVYSLNVVGYYNVVAPANTKILLGNQLHTTNDTLVGVIPSPGVNAQFFKFNGGFTSFQFDDLDLAWTGNTSLAPGEGGFFISTVNTTLTFVGEVVQGNTTNTLPIGVKVLRTSIVPQEGKITTDLKLPAEPNDQAFTFANGGFTSFQFDDLDLVWAPFEFTNKVGGAFFYTKNNTSVTNQWIRNFTVQ